MPITPLFAILALATQDQVLELPPQELLCLLTEPQVRNENRTFQLKDLQRVTLTVGKKSIKAWVMDNNAKRQEGMMFLTNREVKDEDGMIFVFGQVQRLSFWMRNTILPLDIIYIDGNKKVINIGVGRPFDESGVPATAPGRFVLELKAGQAKKFGIKPGMKIGIPASVKSKD